ncbi:MAG: SIS domain-containing protein [Proteobacteria bacterium]|nr:SIS domain-containing protein [Pseudomonadota bacterium]
MTGQFRREAREAPRRIADLLARDDSALRALTAQLQARPPAFCLTVARGSSDHAAGYARYMIETIVGAVTASAAPSVVTQYRAPLSLTNALVLAFSQSGTSPDVVETIAAARRGGALTVAFVNAESSALAAAAEVAIALAAGPELAVAATKSFIAMLVAAARLVALWRPDRELLDALVRLPAALDQTAQCDWSRAVPTLAGADRVLVIARGRTLPIAQEIALKLKEVARLHAEPFSAAELMHGPIALVEAGFLILAVATRDETLASLTEVTTRLRDMSATVFLATPPGTAVTSEDRTLLLPAPLHPALDPIVAAQAFYPFVAALAEARGLDPDRPSHLVKVTRTY